MEISIEGVVLQLGLRVFCFPFLDGGSWGPVFWRSHQWVGHHFFPWIAYLAPLGVSPTLEDLGDVTMWLQFVCQPQSFDVSRGLRGRESYDGNIIGAFYLMDLLNLWNSTAFDYLRWCVE